jgi:hypothetical protein
MIEQYESLLASPRKRFFDHTQQLLLHKDAGILLSFLIYYCSQAIKMTESVPSWIERAARRCEELGYVDLGKTLYKHAQHEMNHHLLLLNDAQALIKTWNQHSQKKLNPDDLIHHPATTGVIKYQKLHEDSITSTTPYCQLAIEYEIEQISIQYGPPLLELCGAILGQSVLNHLSFLQDHIKLDVAHTNFNKNLLKKFLSDYPESLNYLANSGIQALLIYDEFISDCYHLAVRNHHQLG